MTEPASSPPPRQTGRIPLFLDLVLEAAPTAGEPREPRRRSSAALPIGAVGVALVVTIVGLVAAAALAVPDATHPAVSARTMAIAATSPPAPRLPEPPPLASVQVTSDVYGGLRFAITTQHRPVEAVVVVEPAGTGDAVRRRVMVTRPRQLVEVQGLAGGPAVWSVKVAHAPPVSGWRTVFGVPAAPPPTPWPDPSHPTKKPAKPGHRHAQRHG